MYVLGNSGVGVVATNVAVEKQ